MHHPIKISDTSDSSAESHSSDDESIENIVENFRKLDQRLFLGKQKESSNSEPSIYTPSEALNNYKDTRNITSSNAVLSPNDNLKRRLYEAEKIANDQAEKERRDYQDDIDAKEKKAKRKARKRAVSDAYVIEASGAARANLAVENSPSKSNVVQEDESNAPMQLKLEKSRKNKSNKVANNNQEYIINQNPYIESSGTTRYADSLDNGNGNENGNQIHQDSFVNVRHGESSRPESSGNKKYSDPVSPVGQHDKERKRAKINEQYSNIPTKNIDPSNLKLTYEGNLPPLGPKGPKIAKSPRKELFTDHDEPKQYTSSNEDLRKVLPPTDESSKKPFVSAEPHANVGNNSSAHIHSLAITKPPIEPYLLSPIPKQQLEISIKPALPEIQNIIQSSMQPPMNLAPPAISKEDEQLRLAVLHSSGLLDELQEPRLTKITEMTSRLLGRSCCLISLVDADKVFWKAVTWSGVIAHDIKEEPRYESFCSWVVQDNTGRGVTILNATTDSRCTHMRVKPNLEFYSGVPLILGGKYRVGALSIQGPPGGQMNMIDMNILHEMSVWASGELDTIIQQRELQKYQNMLEAQNQLSTIAQNIRLQKMDLNAKLLENSLELIRENCNAQCILMLKLNQEEKEFSSVLNSLALSSGTFKISHLNIGQEMFQELANLTLKREDFSTPFLLPSMKSGLVTRDVDMYLNKKINKCVSEILWVNNAPFAILAAFFEGQHRIISENELHFIQMVTPTLSTILEQTILKDCFTQALSLLKNVAGSLKKNPVQFGSNTGIAPVVAIFTLTLGRLKGNNSYYDYRNSEGSNLSGREIGPKGGAHAQVLAKKQEIDAVLGKNQSASSLYLTTASPKDTPEIQPIEFFELQNDFNQLSDNLAEKYGLKRPKKVGDKYIIFANYGPESGTLDNIATFSHELFFALDLYNQNKHKNINAKVGIHCDFVPIDSANSNSNVLRDHFQSILNCAFNLENISDTILVSETFYHQTKHNCSYEVGRVLVLQGQGAFSTYQLIGKSEESPHDFIEPAKENDMTNKSSMIHYRVPKHGQVAPETAESPKTTVDKDSIKSKEKPKKCTIL